MKKTFFVFPWYLWFSSFFQIQPEFPKIVMTNILPNHYIECKHIIHDRYNKVQIKEIEFGQRLSEMEINHGFPSTKISLKKIFENNVDENRNKPVIPRFHPYSVFHYQYLYGRYARKMSYSDYCLYEEAIANIILSYAHDSKPTHYIFYFSDPSWMYDESLSSYMTLEENQNLEKILFIDLDDKETSLLPLTTTMRYYFWNYYNHPTL